MNFKISALLAFSFLLFSCNQQEPATLIIGKWRVQNTEFIFDEKTEKNLSSEEKLAVAGIKEMSKQIVYQFYKDNSYEVSGPKEIVPESQKLGKYSLVADGKYLELNETKDKKKTDFEITRLDNTTLIFKSKKDIGEVTITLKKE